MIRLLIAIVGLIGTLFYVLPQAKADSHQGEIQRCYVSVSDGQVYCDWYTD